MRLVSRYSGSTLGEGNAYSFDLDSDALSFCLSAASLSCSCVEAMALNVFGWTRMNVPASLCRHWRNTAVTEKVTLTARNAPHEIVSGMFIVLRMTARHEGCCRGN